MKGDRLFFLTMFLALCSQSVSIDTSSESFIKAAKESYEQIIGTVKQAVSSNLVGPCISNPLTCLGLASSVGSAGIGTSYVAKKAVGNQAQDGDWMNVIKGAFGSSSRKEDRLCTNCVPCKSMNFADFKEYRNGGSLNDCLEYLKSLYPEFDIYKTGKIEMDFFDGFGLPGHKTVHTGLVITYPINDGIYVALHVDLATGEGDVDMKGTAETKIEQKLQIIDGAQSQWTHRLVQNCLFQNLF